MKLLIFLSHLVVNLVNFNFIYRMLIKDIIYGCLSYSLGVLLKFRYIFILHF
jgi:hypothetical protein